MSLIDISVLEDDYSPDLSHDFSIGFVIETSTRKRNKGPNCKTVDKGQGVRANEDISFEIL